jgi:[1-hydroxy-2-(trimethylamino)ethyl]phosphonate dioxygenase
MDICATLIEIYTNKATGRYGLSAVNQLQHALQSATMAEQDGENAAFITAALLHDVGHMIHEHGEDAADHGIDDTHEELAAHWLARYFGPEVSEPVRLHVPAKRYLCAVDTSYFGKLSEDSIKSLALQGGPMSVDQSAVRLRKIDDRAKDPQAETPDFNHFVQYIDAALSATVTS